MANALYPAFKEALLSAECDLRTAAPTNAVIKALLVDTADYSYNAAHNDLADVAVAARVATSESLANTSVTNGIFDADDIVVAGVSGDQFEALVLYLEVAASPESGNPLIAYLDSGYANLPCTPDGGSITIVWPNDASKIFTL